MSKHARSPKVEIWVELVTTLNDKQLTKSARTPGTHYNSRKHNTELSYGGQQ